MTDELVEIAAKAVMAERIARRAPGYAHFGAGFISPFPGDYADARAVLAAVTPQIEARVTGGSLAGVWQQAQENHNRYSATDSDEGDIRFFGLGLAGEAGEVANFIKKRWRDGDKHEADLRAECADVLAYTMMLAWKLGMTPESLIEEVARKQQVFIAKMQARGDHKESQP